MYIGVPRQSVVHCWGIVIGLAGRKTIVNRMVILQG